MPTTQVPEYDHSNKYHNVSTRLPDFLDRGFVVSKDPSGNLIHQGDSLLFSGLALYALDCYSGDPIANAFEKMLTDLDGGAYRHPDLAERELSLDGLLGFYRGISKRVFNCGEKDRWAEAMKNHRARVASALPAEFNYVGDMLSYKLGLSDKPDSKRVKTLAFEITQWANLVKLSKSACYRIHLGLLVMQILDQLGEPVSDEDRGAFAAAVKGTDMPAVEEYSGRPALDAYLTNFKYNEYQYRHQRCGTLEGPDGLGQDHPGVDFLVGYADLYGASK